MANKYSVRTITCIGCGETVTKRMRPDSKYCSLHCYRKSPRPQRKTGKMVSCTYCGKDVYKRKVHLDSFSEHFCSLEHANKWQGRNKTSHVCITCGSVFKWSPSRQNNNNILYCSLECRDNDPQRKEMLIKMNANQQQLKPNKIEQAGYAILDSIGIDYVAQYIVSDKFTVDAFVPSKNVVIQFDGEYWHGKPDIYPNPDNRQQKRMALDNSQDAYMAKCGIKVIRFWASNITNNPGHVKYQLLSALALR